MTVACTQEYAGGGIRDSRPPWPSPSHPLLSRPSWFLVRGFVMLAGECLPARVLRNHMPLPDRATAAFNEAR